MRGNHELEAISRSGCRGLTKRDHPESGAMGATEAHQQQHSHAAAEDELCTNVSVGFEFNFWRFLGRVASGKPTRGKPTRARLENGAIRAKYDFWEGSQVENPHVENPHAPA